ncbi:hypothetical protein BST61_g4514 [Cercospora zeina]
MAKAKRRARASKRRPHLPPLLAADPARTTADLHARTPSVLPTAHPIASRHFDTSPRAGIAPVDRGPSAAPPPTQPEAAQHHRPTRPPAANMASIVALPPPLPHCRTRERIRCTIALLGRPS